MSKIEKLRRRASLYLESLNIAKDDLVALLAYIEAAEARGDHSGNCICLKCQAFYKARRALGLE